MIRAAIDPAETLAAKFAVMHKLQLTARSEAAGCTQPILMRLRELPLEEVNVVD
jgi:hypothetical protein